VATRPAVRTRPLTRDKLATFLGNPELIKAFEALSEDVSTTLPNASESNSASAEGALEAAQAAQLTADEALAAAQPGGAEGDVQINVGGDFAAFSNFTYNVSTNTLSVGNIDGSALSMTVQPRQPTAAQDAGTMIVRSRSAVKANSNGGGLSLEAGAATGTGTGGNVTLSSGSGTTGGDILLTPGTGGTTDGEIRMRDATGATMLHLRTAAPGGAQQVGLFGTTPTEQPTTGVAAAAFVANAGAAVNDASTFDGYTMRQVVRALRLLGVLA
jgi:hypothetical protein